MTDNLDPASELAEKIRTSSKDNVVETTLDTDAKVLSRITDGIYRQPASALRELISNAFDADATEVLIQTDRPRFDKISVTDDGNGMSPEILARLVHHIGGSSKRNVEGSVLGVTASDVASRMDLPRPVGVGTNRPTSFPAAVNASMIGP